MVYFNIFYIPLMIENRTIQDFNTFIFNNVKTINFQINNVTHNYVDTSNYDNRQTARTDTDKLPQYKYKVS